MVTITSILNAFVTSGGGASLTVNVTRTNLQAAPDPVWLTFTPSGFDAGDPNVGEFYDPKLHEIDYLVDWDLGGAADTWTRVTNLPTAFNDRKISRGPRPSHVYRAAGTYTIRAYAYEKSSGKFASADVVVTVNSADSVFSAAQTIIVAPDSDYTGAPSHDVGNRYTTLAAGLTALENLAGQGRILLKRGQSYSSAGVGFFGANFSHTHFGAWGTGADPAVTLTDRIWLGGGNWSNKDLIFWGWNVSDDWDVLTETGSRNGAFELFPMSGTKVCFHDMRISQIGTAITWQKANTNSNAFLAVDDCLISDFSDYGLYLDCTDTTTRIGVTGVTITRDPSALAGGYGNFGNDGNNQGPVRGIAGSMSFESCDMFSNAGWSYAGLYPAPQSPLRLNAGQENGTVHTVFRCCLEGGVPLIGLEDVAANAIIDSNLLIASAGSYFMIRPCGGTTLRNNVLVRPAPALIVGNSWTGFYEIGASDPADMLLEPLRSFNNTFVDLRASGSFTIDGLGRIAAQWSSEYTNQGNLEYGPSISHTPHGTPTGSTIAGFTPRFAGARFGYSTFSYSVPSTANGNSFEILYSAITLLEGGNPVQTTYTSGRNNRVGAWREDLSQLTFSFGADRVTITNNTGTTLSGTYTIQLDRHNADTIPLVTTSETPDTLQVDWTPAGAALDALTAAPIPQFDIFGVTRSAPADRGAKEADPPLDMQFGANSTGTASVTAALPADVAEGDLLLFFTCNSTAALVSVTGGWATEANVSLGGSGASRLMVFSKTAGASESAPNANFGGTNSWTIGRILRVRNVDATTPVADVQTATEATFNNTLVNFPTVTPTKNGSLIVYAAAVGDDANISSFTDTDLGTITWVDGNDASNTNGMLGIGYAVQTTAAAVGGNASVTIDLNEKEVLATLAISPV